MEPPIYSLWVKSIGKSLGFWWASDVWQEGYILIGLHPSPVESDALSSMSELS